jgi:hypothetical protein
MKSFRSPLRHFGFAILLAVAPSLASPTPLSAAVLANGACTTTATKYKVITELQQIFTTNYVNVKDATISFVQGGANASCVIVTFSASAATDWDVAMHIRAQLDGTTVCNPPDPSWVQTSFQNSYGPNACTMTYVCSNVAPGPHTIRMQFRKSGVIAERGVRVYERTLRVDYIK